MHLLHICIFAHSPISVAFSLMLSNVIRTSSVVVDGISENAILKSRNARLLRPTPHLHTADDVQTLLMTFALVSEKST